VFSRDLTALKERESELALQVEALKASEAETAAVIRSSLDAIVVIDQAGRVIEFNPSAEATFGYAKSFAVGRPIADLIVPPDMRARHAAGMKRYLQTGKARVLGRRVELQAMRADGSLFPVELSITEMPIPHDRLFAAHLRDLSAARAAERELERQHERLRQTEKLSAMGSLLAGVAHELNNPLAILLAQASLLRDKAPTKDVKRRAERIHAAAERSSRIVKSFLAMARQKPPRREPTDLNEVVKAAVEITAYGARSAGVEIVLDLEPALPAVQADRDLMGQVVANLLLNAQQVLAERPGPRRVWVATKGAVEGVELTVEDNGPGVPLEIRARIFEPYFTTKPVGAGTGIGLSVCRNVLQAHGGRVELIEREESGALFRVLLPSAPIATAAPEQGGIEGGGALSILIVDDELDVAHSLSEILETLGHRATVCLAAEKALWHISRDPFDAVFADLRMPGLGGVELRRRIREHDPALACRTIIVTGDTVVGPSVASMGENDPIVLLEKPFTVDDIRAALQQTVTL
jgi:PAS domain S-box-containing protein